MKNFEEKIKIYKEIFAKFNAIHNLSAYKNLDEVIKDSIFPLNYIDKNVKCAIDIGSGAGIPSIFLSFKMQNCLFHLFEPAQKKASFLSFVKSVLKLENIIIHNEKIQNSKKFRADLIVSRAAFKIYDLIKISYGFYDENTQFLLYKGSSFENELKNINANTQIINVKSRNYIFLKSVKC